MAENQEFQPGDIVKLKSHANGDPKITLSNYDKVYDIWVGLWFNQKESKFEKYSFPPHVLKKVME